jgi:glycosyltransferase involved in cell wall biosynthesis
MTDPIISVVIPARNAVATIGDCLRGIASQSLSRDRFEVVVSVDMRPEDGTAEIARSMGAHVVTQTMRGAGAARNDGVAVARGEWIAFSDADCIPSRGWLKSLLSAAQASQETSAVLAVAGQTIGIDSSSAAARFVDLTGGLRADRHLAHQRYPWAPTTNVMYRRDALVAVGGFDPRFDSYEGCDLHTRLLRQVGGAVLYEERAIVNHRHREGWRAYWRQQHSYGRGYAQFFHRYRQELPWSAAAEVREWARLAGVAVGALRPGRDDAALVRRGTFVKRSAQRLGFARTYWSGAERSRWDEEMPVPADAAQ